jgi:peptidoglycan/LPS O-acetylase OafA/YrhL
VLLHNFPGSRAIGLLFRFGQEAVMVFFILSGCVIRLSFDASTRPMGRWFLLRRLLRLYPIIVIGLVLGYATASLASGVWIDVEWVSLIGNLLFLQDLSVVKPGTLFGTYYGNAALWSLSYEWWFYLFFYSLMKWVPVQRQTDLVGIMCFGAAVTMMIMPHAVAYWAAYFIIWWVGNTLARDNMMDRRRAVRWLTASCLVVVTATMIRIIWHGETRLAGVFPILMARHFSFALLVAVVLVRTDLFRRHNRPSWTWIFALFAPVSYGLYVLHYPLAADAPWLAQFGLRSGGWAAVFYGAAALGMACLVELLVQPFIVKWFHSKPATQRVPSI